MKRRITVSYEVDVPAGVTASLDVDQLVHYGIAGLERTLGVAIEVRDATLAIERLDDCPVHTAATEAAKVRFERLRAGPV